MVLVRSLVFKHMIQNIGILSADFHARNMIKNRMESWTMVHAKHWAVYCESKVTPARGSVFTAYDDHVVELPGGK